MTTTMRTETEVEYEVEVDGDDVVLKQHISHIPVTKRGKERAKADVETHEIRVPADRLEQIISEPKPKRHVMSEDELERRRTTGALPFVHDPARRRSVLYAGALKTWIKKLPDDAEVVICANKSGRWLAQLVA